MRLYGSITNRLEEGCNKQDIKVGDGATLMYWSDREPATIIEINKSGKTIKIQRDKATRVDDNGMSEVQEYEFERDHDGIIYTVSKRKNGLWKIRGTETVVRVGVRDKYYDYSF